MIRAENKAARLNELEILLLAHPEGLTQAELARRLRVHRSTIGRYLPDLPAHIYIDDQEGQRWKIDRQVYLVNVRFDLHEAMAVHLATRLLTTRMDRQNPCGASALRKLGFALEKLAPLISHHILLSADEMDASERKQDPIYLEVLHVLTRAWAEQKKVSVVHQNSAGKINEYLFSPYFIEPYAIGQSTYVFGLREPPGEIRTFKVEGLNKVTLIDESYLIPENFNPQDLLADAWGIWFTDDEPIEVMLRFSHVVKSRVLQTRWHKSELTEEQPDGRLVWCAKIADPIEMIPWIRGWGSDCEVIQPASLREKIAEDAAKTDAIYKGGNSA